jgi:hypothetical protein
MVGLRVISGLLAAIGLVQASNVVPGAFIVEYEDGVDIDAELSSVQDVASTRMKLDYKLFKGASIRFHDSDTANDQANLLGTKPAVKKMWPVRLYNVPKHEVHWVAGEDALEGGAAETRQAPEDTFSPHVMTQVNQLREQGIVGEGIKVAVVDTGVSSRTLPACFSLNAVFCLASLIIPRKLYHKFLPGFLLWLELDGGAKPEEQSPRGPSCGQSQLTMPQ